MFSNTHDLQMNTHFVTREMMATIEDLEERTDILTEKEAILSLELEELRVSSQEVIQRLKDEIRGMFRVFRECLLSFLGADFGLIRPQTRTQCTFA